MAKQILAQKQNNYQNIPPDTQQNIARGWIDVIDVDSSSSSDDIFNQTLDFVHRESAMAVLIYLGHRLTGFDRKLIKQFFSISQVDLDGALEGSLFEDAPSTVAFM